MADKLHSERFEEIGPELDAVEHLARAAEALSRSGTETGARARAHLEQARRALHPTALDPEVHQELAQKRDARARGVQPGTRSDPRDAEIAALKAQLAALETGPTVSVGESKAEGKAEQ